jgi:hypothetical protein
VQRIASLSLGFLMMTEMGGDAAHIRTVFVGFQTYLYN